MLDSTAGVVEHAKILCTRRHWFFLPVSMLEARRQSTASSPTAV